MTAEEAAEYRQKLAVVEGEKSRILARAREVFSEIDSRKAVLRAAVDQLKAEREAQGLSVLEVARRTGLSATALSRLESGKTLNPTLETLHRYAAALGKSVELAIGDVAAAPGGTP